jgi:hypothetical protein
LIDKNCQLFIVFAFTPVRKKYAKHEVSRTPDAQQRPQTATQPQHRF